jgi:hypothetical protein
VAASFLAKFAEQFKCDIATQRKTDQGGRRSGAQRGKKRQRLCRIARSPAVVGKTRQAKTGAAAAQIHAKRAHAALRQTSRNPPHIPALMAAGQAVNQQCHAISRPPRRRRVVVQHNAVAVVQWHNVLPCQIRKAGAR